MIGSEAFARFVHLNQKRSDGEEYINHPMRMVSRYLCSVKGPLNDHHKKMIDVIWLHDTIEDSKIPINDFIYDWFGYEVWNIVILLTHDPKLESYNSYLGTLATEPEALLIKWLDMDDNTSYHTSTKQLQKYQNGCLHLQSLGYEIPTIIKERLNL